MAVSSTFLKSIFGANKALRITLIIITSYCAKFYLPCHEEEMRVCRSEFSNRARLDDVSIKIDVLGLRHALPHTRGYQLSR